MTKPELIEKLAELTGTNDPERAHSEADDLLLKYIGDPEIAEAFNAIEKWYA